jgi:hypothetical protein
MGMQERMGLPLHIDRVILHNRREITDDRLYAVVTPDSQGGSYDAEVVDGKGNLYLQMTGYRTVPVPDAVDLGKLKRLHAALLPEPVAA